ncbi:MULTISPECIES: DNA polymerase ligase N-terminal domain-containing protein [Streptomyces]|uniref:3'-phosphoesterase n=1 Tax=Streptomyces cacaoi TaxID=1898 RepID=A0A4Y3QT52_STRCI|nr:MULTISPECIES: DNA polymerase ligase N-terminal domain-containing protein [Streptomyces]NNG89616.1 3'-phosphoesterase [Streptomyces cacaoi]QHF95719.1 3'-phosphoesterase [Streptomyces sp. NHF165]GEB47813.1 3'-phosphoesterase [Streptomyces cacaoi]
MSDKDTLSTYRGKRDFARTAEPQGQPGEAGEQPVYVVQIHDATTLHFDFRLECEGVLKSWSVPKGPSTDPKTKRLAMPTEDHPMEYRHFEGVIPRGEYGAGPVIVWDQGTYEPLTRDFPRALAKGHISFRLHDGKLRGEWALSRFRSGEDGEREAWLLVKKNDRYASPRPGVDPQRVRSAISSRTLKQVAEHGEERMPEGDTGT